MNRNDIERFYRHAPVSVWPITIINFLILIVLGAIFHPVIIRIICFLLAAALIAAVITYKVRKGRVLRGELPFTKLDETLCRFAQGAAGGTYGFKYRKSWKG